MRMEVRYIVCMYDSHDAVRFSHTFSDVSAEGVHPSLSLVSPPLTDERASRVINYDNIRLHNSPPRRRACVMGSCDAHSNERPFETWRRAGPVQ